MVRKIPPDTAALRVSGKLAQEEARAQLVVLMEGMALLIAQLDRQGAVDGLTLADQLEKAFSPPLHPAVFARTTPIAGLVAGRIRGAIHPAEHPAADKPLPGT